MKIVEAGIERRRMAFKEPYQIAYETVSECENVFLKLRTEDGRIGHGCAAPDKGVTGETASAVVDAFERCIEPRLHGEDAFHYARVLEDLGLTSDVGPAATAMVDCAIHDLMAQRAGVPLYKFLGGFRDSIPTSVTIGIRRPQDSLAAAEEYVQRGFRHLKVKGGLNVDSDIECIRLIRESVGPDIEIRFDANQGYTVAQAIDFLHRTESLSLALIEQPTTRDSLDQMARVIAGTDVPVMADESLTELHDVFRLAHHGRADLINIKIMKVGGITEALRINAAARSTGMEAMVGCMDESAMGIAAGLHVALARPNIAYADLDGHLGLQGDPWTDLVVLESGVLRPPGGSGLGVS